VRSTDAPVCDSSLRPSAFRSARCRSCGVQSSEAYYSSYSCTMTRCAELLSTVANFAGYLLTLGSRYTFRCKVCTLQSTRIAVCAIVKYSMALVPNAACFAQVFAQAVAPRLAKLADGFDASVLLYPARINRLQIPPSPRQQQPQRPQMTPTNPSALYHVACYHVCNTGHRNISWHCWPTCHGRARLLRYGPSGAGLADVLGTSDAGARRSVRSTITLATALRRGR
jgi:hypothetical protein